MLIWLLVAALVAAAGWFLVRWYRLRGARVVTCPETDAPAGVAVDAVHAAIHGGKLRLESCSRWPERQGCGQECLRQMEASPESCLVRHILAEWYRGKKCTYCGQEFTEIEWGARKPGLVLADGTLAEWGQVKPEEIPDTLRHASPICCSCYIATSFAQKYPKSIVERSRT
jgi:hypothetical protein